MGALKIIGLILVLALIGGAIYLFTKSSTASTDNKSVQTTTSTTTATGLSGLLSGLNLSGLKLAL